MRADDVEFLARLLGRPLWFLVVYLLVTALAPLMVAWHERSPAAALTTLAAAATAVDLVRVMAGAEEAAYPNYLLVWLFAQQLGFLYADGRLGLISTPALWAVVAGTVVVLTVVTAAGPYPVSMIGMPGEMSNMAPPSVCLVLLAVGQTALVVLARRRLSGWLARPGVWAAVVAVGGRAMTVYLWHLTVLAAVVGLTLALRIGMPAAGTTSWWLSRPLWLSALALVLLPIVASMARLEKWWPIDHGRQHGGSRSRQASSGAEPGVGMLVAAVFVWVALLGYATAGLEPFGAIGGRLFGLHTGWLPSSIFLIGGWSAVMFRVRVAARDTNGS